jgi:hypothetical protein
MRDETIKLIQGETISTINLENFEILQIRNELRQAKKNIEIVLTQINEQIKK